MKTTLKLFVIALITSIGVLFTNVSRSQVSGSVSFSVFYDNLKPYGKWVNHGTYGKVWVSNERDFRPYYSRGHWVFTDEGWTWVSDYSWGWAPFHYGRWSYETAYGWYWVPGYDWGPAWVSWRTGGNYYGWAPLSPGISIRVGTAFGSTIPSARWAFVPHNYITSPYISRHYVRSTNNTTIIRNTTIINNTHVTKINNRQVTYAAGPGKTDVEKVTHTKVQTMALGNASKPGTAVVDKSKNTVNIYKPQVDKKSVEENVNVNANSKTVNSNKDKTVNSNKDKTVNSNKDKAVNSNKDKNTPSKSSSSKTKSSKKTNKNKDVVLNKKKHQPQPDNE